jgi:hypothetical protein
VKHVAGLSNAFFPFGVDKLWAVDVVVDGIRNYIVINGLVTSTYRMIAKVITNIDAVI